MSMIIYERPRAHHQIHAHQHFMVITFQVSIELLEKVFKNFLTQKALKSVYYALFHSNLIYCVPVWSCASQNAIKNIKIMQKKPLESYTAPNIIRILNLFLKSSRSYPSIP